MIFDSHAKIAELSSPSTSSYMMARQEVHLPHSAALFKPKTLGELLLSQASSTGAWNDINLVISFFKNAIEVESERLKSLVAVTDVS